MDFLLMIGLKYVFYMAMMFLTGMFLYCLFDGGEM